MTHQGPSPLPIYETPGLLTRAPTRQPNCRLIAQPPEIFAHILSNFGPEDDADVICLALTCKALWVQMQNEVYEAIVKDYAPWAGDRVIMLGSCAHTLPRGCLTNAELGDLAQSCPDIHNFRSLGLQSMEYKAYNIIDQNFERYQPSLKVTRTVRSRLHSRKLCEPSSLDPNAGTRSKRFFPSGKPWCIRNLTRNEFFQGDRLKRAQPPSSYSLPFIEPMCLGDVIISQGSWTDVCFANFYMHSTPSHRL
jgi:hypothetical protein